MRYCIYTRKCIRLLRVNDIICLCNYLAADIFLSSVLLWDNESKVKENTEKGKSMCDFAVYI